MDYRHLFRQMGIISRQAMMNMNHEASQYNLDNNLFLILIRIVEHEGLNQSQLSHMVKIDKTTLSRSLRKLEDKGFITKKVNSKNKKFKELFPTTKALHIYDRLIGFETIYIQSVMKNLTSSELFQLEAILNKIENSQ
ncbi:hypothetical protein ANG6_0722 [Streptococcus anginosus T5]|uniref:HTH marR-type domain-containing protein n=1 Tax=Streptococcus anginosus T5 TaxID=1163302 RepID=A0AAN4P8A1_STRAP|nr:MarR family transcriptional regulator [Streptococcus anginosus]GAD46227.1 hypothetical protein ANG6_0722 [Streptococcus anginosus T5]